MTVYMTKERVVRESVKWLKEKLPKKAVEDISDSLDRHVKTLAYNVERFSREQDAKISGRHIYRGKTYAFYLKIEKKYGLFGTRSLVQGPPGSLANAEAFAKHGVTRGMFGTSTKNMVLGAIFFPPNHVNTAMDCTSYSNNIPFMIYKLPRAEDRRKESEIGIFKNRWRFKTPQFYAYCEEDVVKNQLDVNESILRQKGF